MSPSNRDFQNQINQRIDQFVADITQLARENAYRTLASALEVSSRRAPAFVAAASGGRRKRGQRELAEVSGALLALIVEGPGQRMQALAKALGTTPKDLSLPSKRLLSEKMVRTEGQKRSTAYFATARGKKAAAKKAAAKKAAAKKAAARQP